MSTEILWVMVGVFLFIIGFLLGRSYNSLKRKEILHIHNKTEELTNHIHDLKFKISELEKQKEKVAHEKEERLKKWMDATNNYQSRIKHLKKR